MPLKAEVQMWICSVFSPSRKECLGPISCLSGGIWDVKLLDTALGSKGVQGVLTPQKAGSHGRGIAAPSALPHLSLRCKSLIQSWFWWLSPHFWHFSL